MIRAAGAIIWRENSPFELEVLVIHRPQYDDWSFPKGKVDDGESPIAAAYREVKEETGVDAIFGQYLGTTSYKVDENKKKVKYWMARAKADAAPFVPNAEVDKIEWVDSKTARHFLTHDEDRDLLDDFMAKERYASTLVLLRHAKAVKRSEWNDYDLDRPLNNDGVQQSQKLVKQLEPFGIQGIYSSDATRCFTTVEPFSTVSGVKVNVSKDLNEESFEKSAKTSVEYVRQVMKFDGNQLVSGHNPIIPHVLSKIARVEYSSDDLSPADAWIVHHRGDKIVAVEFLARPTI
ncbi:Ap6A_hydrolase domain containing protein [Candidatus Nanopelagicaceae bacterium]